MHRLRLRVNWANTKSPRPNGNQPQQPGPGNTPPGDTPPGGGVGGPARRAPGPWGEEVSPEELRAWLERQGLLNNQDEQLAQMEAESEASYQERLASYQDSQTARASQEFWDQVSMTSSVQMAFLQAPMTALSAIGGAASWAANNAGSRVFWSGGTVARNAAATWARSNNAVTLEMTAGGRAAIARSTGIADRAVTGAIWDSASRYFAATSQGGVNMFAGPTVRAASVWMRVEYPVLVERAAQITVWSAR